MNSQKYCLLLATFRIAAFCLTCVASSVQAATFITLGDFSDNSISSGAKAISSNGETIVGSGSISGTVGLEASGWNSAHEIFALREPLVDDGHNTRASDVSSDGSVIAFNRRQRRGPIGPPSSELAQEAYRWTASEGITQLIPLEGYTRTTAAEVSDDGQVIVGVILGPLSVARAFHWTEESGMRSLGTLMTNPTIEPTSAATAVSADGLVIVGTSSFGLSDEAFRWTKEAGMQRLGDLPGGFASSGAIDISADGRVIVGRSSSSLSQAGEAFRWTAETGMQGLGLLNPGDNSSSSLFASSDGELVFGQSYSTIDGDGVPTGFVWDRSNGMRDLFSLLANQHGLAEDLAGWSGLRAFDISDNGLSLVGGGINPDGNGEAWLIQLAHPLHVPEPISIYFLVLALGVFALVGLHPRRVAPGSPARCATCGFV